jgi:DNA polymerase III alpha subunit
VLFGLIKFQKAAEAQGIKPIYGADLWLKELVGEKTFFYRQSDVVECTELTWYLNCFTPYPMLANAHSFKDKSVF